MSVRGFLSGWTGVVCFGVAGRSGIDNNREGCGVDGDSVTRCILGIATFDGVGGCVGCLLIYSRSSAVVVNRTPLWPRRPRLGVNVTGVVGGPRGRSMVGYTDNLVLRQLLQVRSLDAPFVTSSSVQTELYSGTFSSNCIIFGSLAVASVSR